MLELVSVFNDLRKIDMANVDAATVQRIAQRFNTDLSEEQTHGLASLLSTQDFEGSVAEFLTSGQWMRLFAQSGTQQPSEPQLWQCRHCGQPNYL